MKNKVTAGVLALAATVLWTAPSAAFTLDIIQGRPDARQEAPVILAQSADLAIQVQQLEEQIRQLNGRVEEMSFQLLQMQEQLRKAQEDNEFRFQELEGGGKKKSSLETAPGDTAIASGETSPGADTTDTAGIDPDQGRPPIDLGELKVDESGNVLGAEANPEGADTAGLPPATEASFAEFIANHPDSKKIADANYWLGEAQYTQGKFSEAAKTFLNGYKTYEKSARAPEMLLKLAMSLAALDSKDTACATLRQVQKAYPKASRAVITRVASEQKRLAC
jgi:tol-pal system protein YbgF